LGITPSVCLGSDLWRKRRKGGREEGREGREGGVDEKVGGRQKGKGKGGEDVKVRGR